MSEEDQGINKKEQAEFWENVQELEELANLYIKVELPLPEHYYPHTIWLMRSIQNKVATKPIKDPKDFIFSTWFSQEIDRVVASVVAFRENDKKKHRSAKSIRENLELRVATGRELKDRVLYEIKRNIERSES